MILFFGDESTGSQVRQMIDSWIEVQN